MPEHKFLKRKVILNSIPFVLALLVFLCVKLGIHFPDLVEQYYSRGIYPVVAKGISLISSMVTYSLWDIFWLGILLFVLTGLILVFFGKVSYRLYLLRLAQSAALFYSLFYLSWGFNYFRPAIEKRLGWYKVVPYEEDFRNLLDSLIFNTNKYYTSISGMEYAEIEKYLEESYSINSALLGIDYPNGTRTPKTILISSYFVKSGISGYFGPFFNEVHINHYQLPVDYPFVLAHEKAHQFGIANEAEANLTAFIVCTGSPDIRLKYSGYMHILLYFLNDAYHMADYPALLEKINKPVMKDIISRQRYYDKLRNKTLEDFQTAANNAYLKTQRIKKGVKNYNQVVGLMISWYIFSGKLPLGTEAGLAEIK